MLCKIQLMERAGPQRGADLAEARGGKSDVRGAAAMDKWSQLLPSTRRSDHLRTEWSALPRIHTSLPSNLLFSLSGVFLLSWSMYLFQIIHGSRLISRNT